MRLIVSRHAWPYLGEICHATTERLQDSIFRTILRLSPLAGGYRFRE